MTEINALIVSSKVTLRDALVQLDKTGDGVLLLVNERGSFLRTVTDGDLRRLLLKDVSLDDTLAVLPLIESIHVADGVVEQEALALMNQQQIDHLPVLNAKGDPINIFLRRKIDSRILLSTPHLGEHEMGFVAEAFRTNWIAPLGPNVDAFEKELSDYVGIGHAAALSSGTAALHLAMRLLGVGAGDTVFCSTLTFIASVNPVMYQGAIPVFIDSEPDTWNMSPQALASALEDANKKGKLPKAVVVVNLYGQSADFDPILELCDQYDVPVIEDAAESLGATYKNKQSGTLGKLGVFSFNGNKIITTSGGGMLVSEDGNLIEKARHLATQARDPAPWYEHTEVGYNYRMSNILAGIGRGQMRVLEDRVNSRRAVFARYQEGLRDVSALQWMPEAAFGRSNRWLTVCTLDATQTELTPAKLIEMLSGAGIEARHVWKPMHQQPLFAGTDYYANTENTDFSGYAFARGICLPSGSNMTEAQQSRIIEILKKVLLGN
ncbi:aminotransferase class I/II-fold pyridoxal phosphate-dependent enzyme [Methylotenera sp.]|uniref:aminotransferase class I/II-fold pyridoxal phosphate-dependent enzyme n=1 Tax=Methylotenera sp. TaxID=2051956 RepID=UPI002734817A|nr:aminotransferase class I/II-fold pyridoxal phosphate-dependent enzyme [Methylotenera sp.]MDP3776390.1 aminotransferase class I/II-fold pyridoxal phosphate-dependent enzyme [Methylotenera sp.]